MKQRQNITSIVYDRAGRVLAIGKNSYQRSRRMQRYHAWKVGQPKRTYVHSEIDALSKVKDLSKAHKIVITRYLRDGTTGNASPCPICLSAINATNIKIIEHS